MLVGVFVLDLVGVTESVWVGVFVWVRVGVLVGVKVGVFGEVGVSVGADKVGLLLGVCVGGGVGRGMSGVSIGVGVMGQPLSSAITARTRPAILMTPPYAGHAAMFARPKLMFTPVTNSATLTTLSPLQSPVHDWAVAIEEEQSVMMAAVTANRAAVRVDGALVALQLLRRTDTTGS